MQRVLGFRVCSAWQAPAASHLSELEPCRYPGHFAQHFTCAHALSAGTTGDEAVVHMQLDGEPWAQDIPVNSTQPLLVRPTALMQTH